MRNSLVRHDCMLGENFPIGIRLPDPRLLRIDQDDLYTIEDLENILLLLLIFPHRLMRPRTRTHKQERPFLEGRNRHYVYNGKIILPSFLIPIPGPLNVVSLYPVRLSDIQG